MVSELDWDTIDDLRAALASPEGRACAADAARMQELATFRTMIFTVFDREGLAGSSEASAPR
jgi:hypothetical protein